MLSSLFTFAICECTFSDAFSRIDRYSTAHQKMAMRNVNRLTIISSRMANVKSLIGEKNPNSVENKITIISFSRSIILSPFLTLAAEYLSPVLANPFLDMNHRVLFTGILTLAIKHCLALTSQDQPGQHLAATSYPLVKLRHHVA